MLSELPKERHEKPMLSLDKTKEVSKLKEFLGSQKARISWKLDGLTIVLTYQNGTLQKAVTREMERSERLSLTMRRYLRTCRFISLIREN